MEETGGGYGGGGGVWKGLRWEERLETRKMGRGMEETGGGHGGGV